MTTDKQQIEEDITRIVASSNPRQASTPRTRDVTASLLRESAEGPGELPRLVAKARPAKNIAETPTLAATLSNLSSRHDRSMGFVSKPLAYSSAMRVSKREHANLIRLIKGGYVHVCEVDAAPPSGSVASRDAPYGDRHYVLHVGPCGGDDREG